MLYCVCMVAKKATQFREQLAQIKAELLYGSITYDEAIVKAKPILDKMNEIAIIVAKKHKRRHTLFTLTGFLR